MPEMQQLFLKTLFKEKQWQNLELIQLLDNVKILSNTIYSIAPTETPVVSSIGKTKATATYHEWQTDTLADAVALQVL